MIAHRSALISVLAMASLFIACDKSGIHPLGVSKDVVVPCAAQSTWMRSTEKKGTDGNPTIATEVLILGVADPADMDPELEAAGEDGVCFNFGTVDRDSTSALSVGRFVKGRGGYEAHIGHLYTFIYQPEVSMFKRLGANRDDYSPPLEVELEFAMDGDHLLMTYGGDARRLTRIEDVIARLDPNETVLDAPGGPKDIYRMFNLSLFMGQPRISNFGAVGMTTYLDKALFQAFIEGTFSIHVTALTQPDVHIEYFNTQEIGGVIVDGLQITYANISGSGTMSGVLEAKLYTDPLLIEAPYITAFVDYEEILISKGVGAGGTYTLKVGELEHIIDYDIASDEDFTRILPIEEGLP